nr:hypothetical protein Iba_chr01bCG0110 [Ipomoea batatas]
MAAIIKPCHRNKKIPWSSKTICTYWPKIRELKMSSKNFTNITSRFSIRQINSKAKSLRNNNYFTRIDLQPTTFSCNPQPYMLRNYQKVSISIAECTVVH